MGHKFIFTPQNVRVARIARGKSIHTHTPSGLLRRGRWDLTQDPLRAYVIVKI